MELLISEADFLKLCIIIVKYTKSKTAIYPNYFCTSYYYSQKNTFKLIFFLPSNKIYKAWVAKCVVSSCVKN